MVQSGKVKEVVVHDVGDLVPVLLCGIVHDIMLPRHHLQGRGVPECLNLIDGAVSCSQNIAGGKDGASTDWNILSS